MDNTAWTLMRLMRLVNKDFHAPCWRWRGAVDARGFGRFKFCGQSTPVHRLMFRIMNPGVSMVDKFGRSVHIGQTCRNNWCVNPKHLAIKMSDGKRRF